MIHRESFGIAHDLIELGDTVSSRVLVPMDDGENGYLAGEEWTDGIVCKVYENGNVDVFRPYAIVIPDGLQSVNCHVQFEIVENIDQMKLVLLKKGHVSFSSSE